MALTLNDFVQTYSPGSDIAMAFRPNQIVWGRTGNDVVVGYNANINVPLQKSIDVLLGDVELPELVDPYPRNWHNKFVLGDWKRSYYANGNPFLLGLNDFAVIVDFEASLDTIQLNGEAKNYQLFDFGFGTAIIRKQEFLPGIFIPDVVAITFSTGLDLNANYFKYLGSTPPAPTLPKAKQIGTAGFDLGRAVTTDRHGNVYVVGGTSGDIGGLNQGNRDIWFTKFDAKGNEIWRQQIGSDNLDFPFGIGVDAKGNVYLVGATEGDINGSGRTSDSRFSDIWLAKFDKNGDSTWLKQFTVEGNVVQNGYGLEVDARGNIEITGVVDKPTPAGSFLPNQTDAWVARYDTNGNQKWLQQIGSADGIAFDESYAIAVDKKHNAYITGFTTNSVGGTYGGLYDGWVAKYDKNGEKVWAKNIGSADYDWAWGVDTDSKGNVYVTGWTLGNLGGTNLGSFDSWLAKFDKDGNQKWVKQFGTSGDDQAFEVTVDSQDNIYVTGYTDGAFAGKTNSGEYDAWIAKFNGRGEQKWVQQFGSTGTDQAYDVTVSADGHIYATGLTDGSLGAANQGSFDAWIVKLNANNGRIQDFTGNNSGRRPRRRGLDLDLNRRPGQELIPSQPVTTPSDPSSTLPILDDAAITQAIGASLAAFTGSTDTSNLQAFFNGLNLTPYGSVGTPSTAPINNPVLPAPTTLQILPIYTNQPPIFPT